MSEQIKKMIIPFPCELHKKLKRESVERGHSMTRTVIDSVAVALGNPNDVSEKNIQIKTCLPKEKKEIVFHLVDVKLIKPMPGKPKMTSDRIESAAKSIIEIGLIKPLMLKQISVDEYECLSSADELGAVRRAQELDPVKCEMVSAMVIPSRLVETVKKQISMFSPVVESSTWPNMK